MSAVATLPTRTNAEVAFARFCDLVQQAEADPEKRVSLEHNIEIARSWVEWRDLFIALDRPCR